MMFKSTTKAGVSSSRMFTLFEFNVDAATKAAVQQGNIFGFVFAVDGEVKQTLGGLDHLLGGEFFFFENLFHGVRLFLRIIFYFDGGRFDLSGGVADATAVAGHAHGAAGANRTLPDGAVILSHDA